MPSPNKIYFMRKLLFLSFVLFAWQMLPAQDRIVTASGDTILCRIVSVSGNHIVYEQSADKKQVSGRIIPLSDVAEYFRTPATPSMNEVYILRTPEQPWLLSFSAGGAYLPWLLESVVEESAENDDYKKLNKGIAFNANVHYLLTNHAGLGIQYSFFTSGRKSNYPTMINSYYPMYSNLDIRERQYINYAGLSVVFRQFLDINCKLSLNETLSGGLLLYRAESRSKIFLPPYYISPSSGYGGYYNQFQYISQNNLITGNTFGATIGISAEYKILPCLSVGFGGNFLYGNLSKISSEYKDSYGNSGKSTDEKLENPAKLSRIDYSLVIRFQL